MGFTHTDPVQLDMSEQVTSTSFDSHLTALGHIDRRRLLIALLRASKDDDLPVDIDQLNPDAAERPYRVRMVHMHLPKLEDYGFVSADFETTAVTTGPRFTEILPLLELLAANQELLADDWV